MKYHKNRNRWVQAVVVLAAGLMLMVLAKHYEYPDIQVNYVEEVIIPGIADGKEYEFLFLTDLHLAIKTREEVGPYGSADERIRAFSNARGTISAKQLPQWIDYANKNELNGVLMGGDILDYYSDVNAVYLKNQLDGFNMPYLFTIGNHELFLPWEETIAEDSVIYDCFKNGETAFQLLEFEEFVICAIDDEVYQVNEASLIAMKNWLKEHPDKPMILLAHVPFYTENDRELLDATVSIWGQALVIGTGEGTRDTTAVSRDFLDLILGEESPVVAIFTGDNHYYHKGKLTDSITQWVGTPAYAGDGMIIKIKGK